MNSNRIDIIQPVAEKELLRNAKSGWPLIQVSFFTPNEQDKNITYTNVLAGEKCHFFYIGAFSFAVLLTKLPGKCVIKGNDGQEFSARQCRLENVNNFLHDFYIRHVATQIQVRQLSNAYGKLLEIKMPSDQQNIMSKAFGKIFEFAVNKSLYISKMDDWKNERHYSEALINAELNHNAAVFYNGQIFVDLGVFLREMVKSEEIYADLAGMFKVNEFRRSLNVQRPEMEESQVMKRRKM